MFHTYPVVRASVNVKTVDTSVPFFKIFKKVSLEDIWKVDVVS